MVILSFEEKGLGVHEAKLCASQAFGMAKLKGNSQQTRLFNTTELCSHSQLSQHWPSFHLDTRPLIQIATVLQKSSQQKQTTQVKLVLNMKFISSFMYHSVYDEKLNLLTWVISLIFSDQVTYIYICLWRLHKHCYK